jgi:hypothetical protein
VDVADKKSNLGEALINEILIQQPTPTLGGWLRENKHNGGDGSRTTRTGIREAQLTNTKISVLIDTSPGGLVMNKELSATILRSLRSGIQIIGLGLSHIPA